MSTGVQGAMRMRLESRSPYSFQRGARIMRRGAVHFLLAGILSLYLLAPATARAQGA